MELPVKQKILIAYCTNAGSTTEVASCVADTLRGDGVEVDVNQFNEVKDVSTYHAVIVGGPMILGWHRRAISFLRKHRKALTGIPVACFMTALSVIKTDAPEFKGIPLHCDPKVLKEPLNPAGLSFKEKHTTVESYLKPVLRKAKGISPVSVGFFAGKLDYSKLNIFQMLFVMLIIGARPGDSRNWDDIRSWVEDLRKSILAVP